MIVATTPALEGFRITEHLGVVSGVAVEGMDVVRDLFAAFRNVWGGRSRGYEKGLEEARERALLQMVERAGAAGANAVIGVTIDYEYIDFKQKGGMALVGVSGTAVRVVAEKVSDGDGGNGFRIGSG